MVRREQFDVVVVGGGGADFAAAIEARSYGRDVVLLEKNPEVGGTTVWSVGSISASNSPHQIRACIKDSPLHHWEDMPLFAARDKRLGGHGEPAPPENGRHRQVLTDNVTEMLRWLMDKGIVFSGLMLMTMDDFPDARSGSV